MQTVLIGGVPKILCGVPSMAGVPLVRYPCYRGTRGQCLPSQAHGTLITSWREGEKNPDSPNTKITVFSIVTSSALFSFGMKPSDGRNSDIAADYDHVLQPGCTKIRRQTTKSR
ncbi:hypothetical protein TNCV_2929221 [Trichonephila clavipes]|nr:hypothetical protein TNCV_2929221 [Trichonephila clavipes]